MNEDYEDYDDDLLRHYYELELEVLRRGLRAFARRNPNEAARLSIGSDGQSDDPGVERLVQSTALLHARHRAKIEDDYPEFAEALTNLSYPQYLRPFPSCAVAQFGIEGVFDSLTDSVRIERGTPLLTMAGRCRFRTAYDVVLAPLRIARAQYAWTPSAPAGVKLPSDTSGMVSVTFRAAVPGVDVGVAMAASVRIHLAGQPVLVAALMDTLLLRTTKAYVEDSTGRWTPLAAMPVSAVGYAPHEGLFTDEKEPGESFGLLAEYFAFADRFHFIDIDLGALPATVPGEQLTLHLAVAGVARDSWPARQLAHLCADHLRLFCTPVANLFEKKGLALRYEPKVGAWPIHVQGNDDSLTEVWSVDDVRDSRGNVLDSSAALFGVSGNGPDLRWKFMQSKRPQSPAVGRRAALGLVRADGSDEVGEAGIGLLRVDVTCSNGDLPRSLTVGAPAGDMRLGSKGPANSKIAMLRVPTAVARLARANGALWRLIGQQTPHPIRLNQAGLPALKQILQQFGALSPAQARHIDGIVGLNHRSVMTMMVRPPQPAMVRGIEITLVIDERQFATNSVAVFARVMECFFVPYAYTNSFVQLIVASSDRSRLWQGEPIRGTSPLL